MNDIVSSDEKGSTLEIDHRKYMEQGIYLDMSMEVPTTNPKSVEFLYLPSGEILAKPSNKSIPLLVNDSGHREPLFNRSNTSSIQDPGLSPRKRNETTRRSNSIPTHQHQRILELETLLQNEKKRSLDKMRMLLDEQDKTHDLQSRFTNLQSKVHHLEDVISQSADQIDELQKLLHTSEARNASLAAEIAYKSNQVDLLNHELQDRITQVQVLEQTRSISSTASTQTDTCIREEPLVSKGSVDSTSAKDNGTQLLLNAIMEWKAMVDSWLANPSTLSPRATIQSLITDFPTLPPSSEKEEPSAAIVTMLKRRLAFVDKEWRQTHSKYVELKELCARQCVREADLQNFVNEHRLRGQCNLRIPPSNSMSAPTPPTLTAAPSPPPPMMNETRQNSEVPRNGHLKVVIKRADQGTTVIDTTTSAIRAKLQSMPASEKSPSNTTIIHQSSRLTKKHQRTPTPKKAPTTAKKSPPGRPWV